MHVLKRKKFAIDFAECLLPILEKRYKEEICLDVVHAVAKPHPEKKIEKDSALFKKRIQTKTFAPNKQP